MIEKKINILLLFFLLVGGGYFLYQGLKIEINLRLQIFLKKAWEKSLITKNNIKPWSKMDSYPIFKLEVPKLNVEHIILNKITSQALSFAPGFIRRASFHMKGKPLLFLCAEIAMDPF